MSEWLLLVGADLRRRGTQVVVGPETARVCKKTAEEARKRPDARICVPAGWSPRYEVAMGDGPVRSYLTKECDVENSRIVTPVYGNAFTTNGEMTTFANYLNRINDRRPRIVVVVRYWHAPRALMLLTARLKHEAIRPEEIETVLVNSSDVIGVVREPIAWLKNIPNF